MGKVNAPPIADYQIRCVQALRRGRGIDDDLLAQMVQNLTGRAPEEGHTGLAKMTFDQANALVAQLGGTPFRPPRTNWRTPPPPTDAAAPAKRTRQHHRKQAAVEQLATAAQLNLIAALASQRTQMDAAALAKFCERTCGAKQPRTTKEANKAIEALKSMNRRDGLWHG